MSSRHVDRRARMERLERLHASSPGLYRLQLGAFALFGQAVLGSGLLLSVGLVVVLGVRLALHPLDDWRAIFPLLVLLPVSLLLVRAVWVRWVPPEGHALAPGEAPALQAEIERIRRQTGAPPLHGIYLNDDLNAAAAWVPGGWRFWRHRQYLVLGLPLLRLLDRRELAAVIAHEFGHFHSSQGVFDTWIYRLRVVWHRVAEGTGPELASQAALVLFSRWYARRFDERSFVLARQREYEADQAAAFVAGAEHAATALVRIELASRWLEQCFWPSVRESVSAQSYPPMQAHARLGQGIAEHRRRQRHVPEWLQVVSPAIEDTHPRLRQRLEALGVPEVQPLQADTPSAAEEWLDPELRDRLELAFSRHWQEQVRAEWEAQHQAAQKELRRLDELQALERRAPAEWLEYAALAEKFRPQLDVVSLYREGVRQSPHHALAHARFGLQLVRHGHGAEGWANIERGLQMDTAQASPVLDELEGALCERDSPADDSALARLRTRFEARATAGPDAAAYAPHGLDEMHLRALSRALAGHERVARAWLVREAASGLSATPHFLLLVEWRGSVASEAAALPQLVKQIVLPGTFALHGTGQQARLWRQLRGQAGEPVYRRR